MVMQKKLTVHRTKTSLAWIGAVLFSLVLNMGMFGLLPGLFDRNPLKPDDPERGRMVDFIRMKRPEPPVERRRITKEIERKEPEKKRIPQQPVQPRRVKKPRIDLPFEINPELPAGPGSLRIPPMEMAAVEAPVLKPAYGMNEIDHPLIPLAKASPIYPLRARRRNIEGWVNVRFLVTEEGFVDTIEILESKPKKIFDSSVVRCVSAWRFSPGTVEGTPVKTWAKTTIRFELK